MRAVVFDAYGQEPVVRSVPEPDCPAGGGGRRGPRHRGVPVGLARLAWARPGRAAARAGPRVRRRGRPGRRGRDPGRASGTASRRRSSAAAGVCEFCRAGDAQVCPDQYQPGFTGPGSFAEQVMVPAADTNVVRLPDAARVRGGRGPRLPVRDGVPGGAGARPGPAGAVAGGVRAAVASGCPRSWSGGALGARVVAVDVSAAALERARRLGAEAAVDAARPRGGRGAGPRR